MTVSSITMKRVVARPIARTTSHSVRMIAMTALWALLGCVGGLLLMVAAPRILGYQSLTVMSGSMEPVIHTGDVVVVKPVSAASIRPGDIVTFRSPDEAKLITHRVRSVNFKAGKVQVVTKGDANNAVENWSTTKDGNVGLVKADVFGLGFAMAAVKTPVGRILFVVIPALLLAAQELFGLFRPSKEDSVRSITTAVVYKAQRADQMRHVGHVQATCIQIDPDAVLFIEPAIPYVFARALLARSRDVLTSADHDDVYVDPDAVMFTPIETARFVKPTRISPRNKPGEEDKLAA